MSKVKIKLKQKDALELKSLTKLIFGISMQNPFKIDNGQGELIEIDKEFMKRVFYAIPDEREIRALW